MNKTHTYFVNNGKFKFIVMYESYLGEWSGDQIFYVGRVIHNLQSKMEEWQLKCTTITSLPVKGNNSLKEITYVYVILKSGKLINYKIN